MQASAEIPFTPCHKYGGSLMEDVARLRATKASPFQLFSALLGPMRIGVEGPGTGVTYCISGVVKS
jgi:hypothetical protein